MLYDTIIIGSGPAGLTASIYASRYKLANLVIGKMPGGTIAYAHKVENYPGVPNVTGVELGQRMAEQAKSFGVEILSENVVKIKQISAEVGEPFARVRQTPPIHIGVGRDELAESLTSPRSTVSDADSENFVNSLTFFTIKTESGNEFEAKTLIVASGTERRKLNIPGEEEYLGKGVSYCTNCDAPFFKGKTVVLVGGANAACSGAVHLAEYAEKVYLIYRKSELRAEPVWVQEVKSNPKIEVIYGTNLTKILGKEGKGGREGVEGMGKVTKVEIDNPYKDEKILKTDGVFVEIGGVPATEFLKPMGMELDENGYIKVSGEMETSVAGLFAAGDVTDKSLILQQTITACAQGAIAGASAFKYLKSNLVISN